MKLDNNRLAAFYQLAMDRNFHIAADHLCITQSALSQRIIKLEQEIETTLIIRSHKGINLTRFGTLLFEYVRDVKNMEHELLDKIIGQGKKENKGIIRIAAYSSILRSAIMPALKGLIQSSSDIHVEFFSRELRDLPSMLKTGEVDFIVMDFVLEGVNIKEKQIGKESLIHIKNKNSNEAVFLDHDIEDMTTYNFFNAQGKNNIKLTRCFYDDIYGIINGVEMGFGQAIISQHLLSEITKTNEIEIVPHQRVVSNPVVLHYQENRFLTKLHQQVINQLVKNTTQFL